MKDDTYTLGILIITILMWWSLPCERDIQKRHEELIKEIQKLRAK